MGIMVHVYVLELFWNCTNNESLAKFAIYLPFSEWMVHESVGKVWLKFSGPISSDSYFSFNFFELSSGRWQRKNYSRFEVCLG